MEALSLNDLITPDINKDKVEFSMADLLKSDVDNMELSSENSPFSLSLRISTFEDEKTYLLFVKNCEKLIRGSVEYGYWRKYIKDVLGITACAISQEITGECEIQIHHQIPSLFILTKA